MSLDAEIKKELEENTGSSLFKMNNDPEQIAPDPATNEFIKDEPKDDDYETSNFTIKDEVNDSEEYLNMLNPGDYEVKTENEELGWNANDVEEDNVVESSALSNIRSVRKGRGRPRKYCPICKDRLADPLLLKAHLETKHPDDDRIYKMMHPGLKLTFNTIQQKAILPKPPGLINPEQQAPPIKVVPRTFKQIPFTQSVRYILPGNAPLTKITEFAKNVPASKGITAPTQNSKIRTSIIDDSDKYLNYVGSPPKPYPQYVRPSILRHNISIRPKSNLLTKAQPVIMKDARKQSFVETSPKQEPILLSPKSIIKKGILPKSQLFECQKCKVFYKDQAAYKNHVETHFDFTTKSLMQKRQDEREANNKVYICAKCSTICPTLQLYEQHMKSHEPRIKERFNPLDRPPSSRYSIRFKCDKCILSFTDVEELQNHKETHQTFAQIRNDTINNKFPFKTGVVRKTSFFQGIKLNSEYKSVQIDHLTGRIMPVNRKRGRPRKHEKQHKCCGLYFGTDLTAYLAHLKEHQNKKDNVVFSNTVHEENEEDIKMEAE